MSSQLGRDFNSKTNRKVKRSNVNSACAIWEGDSREDCQNDGKNVRAEGRMFEQVFSIPLVLKEILKNLEIADLLRTSLVDKNWSLFSREILRESKNCLAIIKEEYSCLNLQQLNVLLSKSDPIPFNGLAIPESGPDHECIADILDDEVLSNILKKINVKYLSMHCFHSQDCSSVQIIREIFEKRVCFLEGLRLDCLPYGQSLLEFISLDLTDQWLPNIRVLEFPFFLYEDKLPKQFIQDLVEASPKLQELHGSINVDCLDFILPLKLTKAVRDFNFEPKISALENCVAFSRENPKLNRFSFSSSGVDENGTIFSQWEESCQEDVAGTVTKILESSKESLKKVAFDHMDLVLMMAKWNIPILQNVAHLSLRYNIRIDLFDAPATFAKIDWAKYFPNLKDVSVTTDMMIHMDKDFYLCDSFLQSNSQFVCESVKSFRSTGSMLNRYHTGAGSHIHMFKQIFPNVKEFHLKEFQQLADNLNELWTAWSDLEAIYVSADIHPVRTRGPIKPLWSKFDSVFLGVNEHEAAYLLENIQELEALEIVSTKPSIFNLRKLKKLEFHFFHLDGPCLENRSSLKGPAFVTRLAGQCAFSRLPELTVEIQRQFCQANEICCMAFNDLKPFVKFVESGESSAGEWF